MGSESELESSVLQGRSQSPTKNKDSASLLTSYTVTRDTMTGMHDD